MLSIELEKLKVYKRVILKHFDFNKYNDKPDTIILNSS